MKPPEPFEAIISHNRTSDKPGVEMPEGAWPIPANRPWEDHRNHYDLLAGELAKLYHAGSYSFDDAHMIANVLWSDMMMRQHPFGRESYSPSAELLWRVFDAFECGETDQKGVYFVNQRERDPDPATRFTNPMIAEIVSELVGS